MQASFWLVMHTGCVTSQNIARLFTWRHGSHIGAPKQWNGGHVGLPNQSWGSWTLFLCKHFLLFQLIFTAAGHMIENTLLSRKEATDRLECGCGILINFMNEVISGQKNTCCSKRVMNLWHCFYSNLKATWVIIVVLSFMVSQLMECQAKCSILPELIVVQGSKKLEFQLTLGTSSSQILHALGKS